MTFIVRSPGLDGWHTLGALRTRFCPVSCPARLPFEFHSREDAERLAALKTRILSGHFCAATVREAL